MLDLQCDPRYLTSRCNGIDFYVFAPLEQNVDDELSSRIKTRLQPLRHHVRSLTNTCGFPFQHHAPSKNLSQGRRNDLTTAKQSEADKNALKKQGSAKYLAMKKREENLSRSRSTSKVPAYERSERVRTRQSNAQESAKQT